MKELKEFEPHSGTLLTLTLIPLAEMMQNASGMAACISKQHDGKSIDDADAQMFEEFRRDLHVAVVGFLKAINVWTSLEVLDPETLQQMATADGVEMIIQPPRGEQH